MTADNLLSSAPPNALPDADEGRGAARPTASADMPHAAAPVATVFSAPGPDDRPTQATITGGDEALRGRIVDVLKTVYDPEIPVNIFELGLVYSIDIDAQAAVSVRMTLTSPACPVAGSLPPEIEQKIRGVEGVTAAKVDVVWEPPWSPAKMSDEAKLLLNLPY